MSRLLTTTLRALALASTITGTALAEPDPDQAYDWFRQYLQVDTVNPPGNETRAVEFLGNILDAEGIAWESAESAPGRGNLWARLEGGDGPALILLHHSDVVPADPAYWSVDPLSAAEKDGYVYGRGALDTKGLGISQLAAFIELHRSGVALNRDVIYLASADEEAGGLYGVGWLIEHHPEIFDGAGLLLNEGGGVTDLDGRLAISVEVTQKVPVWLRLSAVDQPGHGSAPNPTSAVTRIVQAMNRIYENPFPARIIPVVDQMFKAMVPVAPEGYAEAFADMSASVSQNDFLRRFQQEYPFYHSLTRDTCSLTRMGGSNKINVVPPSAWAEIDCRMLPDRSADEFVADMTALLEGTGVDIEVIMAFSPAISPTDNPVFHAINEVMTGRHENAVVIPNVVGGFTDSHFTRDLGIASYGFNPEITKPEESAGMHGNDERSHIGSFKRSVGDLYAIVRQIVTD